MIVVTVTCDDPLHPGKVATVARFQHLPPWERPAGSPPWVLLRTRGKPAPPDQAPARRVHVSADGELTTRTTPGPYTPSRDWGIPQAPVADHATIKLRCPLCGPRSLDVRTREDRLQTVLDALNLHGVSCVTLAGLAAILNGSDNQLSGGRL